jgi:hypothetical protein
VINIGALYRMRYGFFILLIIIAANRLMQMFGARRESGARDRPQRRTH